MSYKHFTLDERKYLQQLLTEGHSFRKIAATLERSPSTIIREVKRNQAKREPHREPDNKYWYNHWHAQNLAVHRRRQRVHRALQPGMEEWDFIVAGLSRYWSPEAIAGRWHLLYPERKAISASTIYRYIRKKRFPNISAKTHLRRRGKRIQTRDAIIRFSLNTLFLNGLKPFASAHKLVTGKVIRSMAVSEKAHLSRRLTGDPALQSQLCCKAATLFSQRILFAKCCTVCL